MYKIYLCKITEEREEANSSAFRLDEFVFFCDVLVSPLLVLGWGVPLIECMIIIDWYVQNIDFAMDLFEIVASNIFLF